VSHWTLPELAREAIKRGIVDCISPPAGRPLFSEADLRPHKSQYWLTSQDKREDPEQYQSDVEKICDTYRDALQLASIGTHVVCTDEKTGMQALERLHETKPVRPGLVALGIVILIWAPPASNVSNSSTFGTAPCR
jgi:hypothetical protein